MATVQTSTVEFLSGPTSVVISGPVSPSTFRLLSRTVSDLTAGHKRYVYQLTSKKIRQWSLTFTDLDEDQKRDLEDFFFDIAVGPSNTFVYVHTNGETYSDVRFATNDLEFERTEPGRYRVQVLLELEDTIV